MKNPSMSNYFPQELLVEILHRLPPATLVKCTTVCKSWRSLITSPSFISLHRNHSPSSLLIQLAISDSIISSLRRDDHFLTQTSSLRLPPFNREFSVAGICHGLVCFASEYDDLVICNPSLRLLVELPKPSDFPSRHSVYVAFGFDSRNLDYKVVWFSCTHDGPRFRISPPEVEVYSLASGLWNPVVAPVCTLCCVDSYASYGFVDGVVHWGAKRCSSDDGWWDYFVLTFNFEDEVFGEVMLPETVARVSSYRANVTVVGGGGNGKPLTIYHMGGCFDDGARSYDIWVMKEYGVVGSWNKVFASSVVDFNLEAPSLGITVIGVIGLPVALCVRNGGELLLIIDEVGKDRLYSLDIERKTITDLQIGGEGCICYLYSGYYAESLVLLDKASSLVSY